MSILDVYSVPSDEHGVIYIEATLKELSEINLYYINNYIKRPWILEEVEDMKGVRKRKGKGNLYNNMFHTFFQAAVFTSVLIGQKSYVIKVNIFTLPQTWPC